MQVLRFFNVCIESGIGIESESRLEFHQLYIGVITDYCLLTHLLPSLFAKMRSTIDPAWDDRSSL